MPSSIPIALQTHLAGNTLTTSFKIRVGPTPSGTYFGLTSGDKDEVYDDGEMELTYYASSGVDLSTIEASIDLSVDNGEAQSLITLIPDTGITQAMVDRGEIDTVEFVVYETNYLTNVTAEHRIHGSGVLGRCKVVQGLLAIPEMRSWTQLLDQTGLISKTSILCRVKRFGSQQGEEREWCGYDVTGEWADFVVTSVGAETVREFSIASNSSDILDPSADFYAPGLVEWLSGDNEGRSREVESFAAEDSSGSSDVALRFTTPNPIQSGDTGRIRRDCTRKWEGHNSCETYGNRPKFRGEPNIPIGDTAANSIPGVNSPTTIGSGE